jgi:hypothetical protein
MLSVGGGGRDKFGFGKRILQGMVLANKHTLKFRIFQDNLGSADCEKG